MKCSWSNLNADAKSKLIKLFRRTFRIYPLNVQTEERKIHQFKLFKQNMILNAKNTKLAEFLFFN